MTLSWNSQNHVPLYISPKPPLGALEAATQVIWPALYCAYIVEPKPGPYALVAVNALSGMVP